MIAPPRTAVHPIPAQVRGNFSFSQNGTRAACLVPSAGGGPIIETRTLGWAAGPWRQVRTERPIDPRRQALPCDDGRILLLRDGSGGHEVSVLEPGEPVETVEPGEPRETGEERTVGVIEAVSARLLGSPRGPALGYVIGLRADGKSAIARVDPIGRLEMAGVVPGRVGAAGWLDPSGPVLGFTQFDGDRIRPVAVDLSARGLPAVAAGHGRRTRLLLAGSGSALYADGESGAMRLGWGGLDEDLSMRFPRCLNDIDGVVLPLAISGDGLHIALRVTRGARSRLLIYRPLADSLTEVELGVAGAISGIGVWNSEALWFPCSAPSVPGDLAAVTFSGPTPRCRPPGQLPGPRPEVHLEQFAGPAGPIEAVVYGDWTTSERVMLALHGGPESAWGLDFQPLLACLARAGIAVVAPNQRGSVGYGADHQHAIRGDWGGPDLVDVLRLADHLATRRGSGRHRLGLYGASYGAYLALLAAAARPDLWWRCVVVAPFLSGDRLYAQAGPRVRRLIERLGGRAHHDDRDLGLIHNRLTAPLLIVHGADDEVIPVSQSRELYRLLLRHRRDPAGLVYLEIAGAGHDPYSGPAVSELYTSTLAFLS